MSKDYTKVIENTYTRYMLEKHEQHRNRLKLELQKEERKIQELQRKLLAQDIFHILTNKPGGGYGR